MPPIMTVTSHVATHQTDADERQDTRHCPEHPETQYAVAHVLDLGQRET